jgi:hypothetical protein
MQSGRQPLSCWKGTILTDLAFDSNAFVHEIVEISHQLCGSLVLVAGASDEKYTGIPQETLLALLAMIPLHATAG